jgi:arylsulfatase A-like enzyme
LDSSNEGTFGPGEIGYVQQLADYNSAFGTFFQHLKEAGIDETNTLFIFTPDEGDHFVGVPPVPANCDGAKVNKDGSVVPDVPCTYPAANGATGIGELDLNLNLVVSNAGDATPFEIHSDDAATTYVNGQPLFNAPAVRTLEQTMAGQSVFNPHSGVNESLLGNGLGADLQGAIVDQVGQKLLHMHSEVDPNRDPTFTFFGNPNFFFESSGPATAVVGSNIGSGFAWNHGDIQPEIARTFIGIVGPGVKKLGVTSPNDFFTDHVDLRPTIMMLTGLTDDYQHDGRVITEILDESVLPSSSKAHKSTFEALGQVYKQIDAPFGTLAEDTLQISTYAITSTSAGDVVYNNLEGKIAAWTSVRDGMAAQIQQMLEAAEFGGVPIDEKAAKQLIGQGQELLALANQCVANLAKCAK